jgi:hypothetical protein
MYTILQIAKNQNFSPQFQAQHDVHCQPSLPQSSEVYPVLLKTQLASHTIPAHIFTFSIVITFSNPNLHSDKQGHGE